MSAEELEQQARQVVDRARRAFRSGQTKSNAFRKSQLRALYRFLTEEEAALKQALMDDLHKSHFETQLMEIEPLTADIALMLENLDKWTKPQSTKRGVAFMLDSTEIVPQPFGVALIIGAWNYPVQLALWPLIGAIAAGNCVIVKPSEVAAHTSQVIAEKLPEYLDKECFHVVPGGVDITTALLKQRFDYIFYTGSSQVGRIIMRAAAEHLTPVTLELGGKGPCVVDSNSDIPTVARRVFFGKLLNAGQTCIAPDYVLCDRVTQDRLVEALRPVIKEFLGENPKESRDYGRIVNKRHFDRIQKLIDPNKVAIGGEIDAESLFIAPTVMTNVTGDDLVMQEEVFGPVLPIVPVESKEEAIEFINSRDKPLAMYVFSNDSQYGQDFINQTSSGGFCFNDTLMQAAIPSLPFGGVGGSGMGAYHGKLTFDTFSHKRAVMRRSMGVEWVNKLRYPPFTPKKLAWLKTFLGKKMPSEGGGWMSMLCMLLIGSMIAFVVALGVM